MAQVDKDSLREAYDDVRSDQTETNWARFKYEGNEIVMDGTGVDYSDFHSTFNDDERAFGFVRFVMGDEMSRRAKFAFIVWSGVNISALKRAKVGTDKAQVKQIIQNFAVEIHTSDPEEITEDYVRGQLEKAGGANYGTGVRE